MRNIALLILCASATASAGDVFLYNGKIYTGGEHPTFAEAMLLRDERIAAIGTTAALRSGVASGAQRIDLGGRTVIPGLIDTHTHGMEWALSVVRGSIDLRYPKVRSIPDIQKLVAERAHAAKPGKWIVGDAWDDSKLAEDRYPNRQELDAVAADNPVYLQHSTGHLAVVNTAALKLAGIDAKTANPSGGVIDHDAHGEPTGVLKDNAMGLVTGLLPPPTREDGVEAVAYLSKACAQVGLTTIHDVALRPEALSAYQAARARGMLHVRVRLSPLVSNAADAEKLNALGIATGFGDPWLKLGAAKIFTDGGMAARTIAIHPPSVENEPNNFGLLIWKPDDLNQVQMSLADHGWQLATHAIGDRAIDEVLDSYAAIRQKFPDRDLRNRVIHAGLATPAIRARLKQENVLVDSNPPFVYFLGRHFRRYGAERGTHAYPARSYIENGIVASGGSDVPVTVLTPWWGLWSLVERKEFKSGDVLAPEERITVEQAVKMYTWNGAFAGFEENEIGSLSPGKLADFAVLDRDLFHIPPSEIKDVKVLATWIAGSPVYELRSK